jgi:hypothetical protein
MLRRFPRRQAIRNRTAREIVFFVIATSMAVGLTVLDVLVLFPMLGIPPIPDRLAAWLPPRILGSLFRALESLLDPHERRQHLLLALVGVAQLVSLAAVGALALGRQWCTRRIMTAVCLLLAVALILGCSLEALVTGQSSGGSLVVALPYLAVALTFATALVVLRRCQARFQPRRPAVSVQRVSRRTAVGLLAGAGAAHLAAILVDRRGGATASSADGRLGLAQTVQAAPLLQAESSSLAVEPSGREDALTRRVLHELAQFVGWLQAGGVQGYVGELGWPNNQLGDAAAWNRLVERWYQAADAAGLWVTVWDTGEQRTDYKLAAYKAPARWQPVSRVDTQAAVLEAHPETPAYRRGINVTSGTEGRPWQQEPTGGFSNASPGTYGREYRYESQQTFDFLASRGIRTVRLACYWERLQRQLGGELHPGELDQLLAAVDRAAAAGLGVILNLHNFGGYYLFDGRQGVLRTLGDGVLRVEHFADFWARLSAACVGRPGLVGYGLMNEPVYMGARAWEQQAQAALDAIRATGDATTVLVPGYRWSLLSDWVATHPQPWIADPTGNFRYEAHHYLHASPGLYDAPYPAEVTLAEKRGW